MLRSEVIAGLQALRRVVECADIPLCMTEDDLKYYDDVLAEAKLAVLLNEQNDPHAKL